MVSEEEIGGNEKRNEQIEALAYGMMDEIRSEPTGFNNRVRGHWKKVNGTKEAG